MAALSRRRFIVLNAQFGLTLAGTQLLGADGTANPIELENAKQGSSDWVLIDQARLREIEGFASATSVNRGEEIRIYISTSDPTYRLEIFRMGWYSGLGGRPVFGPIERSGVRQPTPAADPVTGLIECSWSDPLVLQIPGDPMDPANWASGIYVVKLTVVPSGKQSYVVFAYYRLVPTGGFDQTAVVTAEKFDFFVGTLGLRITTVAPKRSDRAAGAGRSRRHPGNVSSPASLHRRHEGA